MTKRKKSKAVSQLRKADENILSMYISEINRIPLMSKEEEEKTAILASMGNKEAKDRLVTANLRFVISIAIKYKGYGLPLEDLISEGNIGLIKAIDHFETGKGNRFITYAVWWIRQVIIRAINEKGRLIRLPTNKNKTLSWLEYTREENQKEALLSHKEEIRNSAIQANTTPEKAQELLNISQDVLSLEDPVSSIESYHTILDYIEDEHRESPDEYAVSRVLIKDIDKALDILGSRAADIIRCRYGLEGSAPMTLKEVGDRYKLCKERIRQIEKMAIKTLRHCHHSDLLQSYLAS